MCIDGIYCNGMRVGGPKNVYKGYCTLAGLGGDRGFLCRDRTFWFYVAVVGFVSRQDLILARCSWVAVMVAPCHDNVAMEIPLSRPRRSR